MYPPVTSCSREPDAWRPDAISGIATATMEPSIETIVCPVSRTASSHRLTIPRVCAASRQERLNMFAPAYDGGHARVDDRRRNGRLRRPHGALHRSFARMVG